MVAKTTAKLPIHEKLASFQMLRREWAQHLTASETVFMLCILDNSRSWGVSVWEGSDDQIANGDKRSAGCCLTARTINRVRLSLQQKGLIIARRTKYGYHYRIDMDWKRPMNLPISKRKRAEMDAASSANVAEDTGQNGGKGMTDWPIHNSREETVKPVEPASADLKVREVVTKVAADTAERRIKRKAQRRTRKGLANLFETWRDAKSEHFPDAPTEHDWHYTLCYKVRAVFKNWPQGKDDGYTMLHEFLEWCVGNWSSIIGARFGRMTGAPVLPDIEFVVNFHGRFRNAWQAGLAEGGTWDTSPELTRLMAGGMSREDALIEIGRRSGREEAWGELETERQALSVQRRASQLAQEQAQQQQRYTADNPHSRARRRPKIAPITRELN